MGLSSHFGRIFHEINHPFTLLVNVYIEKPMENHHAFFISWENSLYIYIIYIYISMAMASMSQTVMTRGTPRNPSRGPVRGMDAPIPAGRVQTSQRPLEYSMPTQEGADDWRPGRVQIDGLW